MNYLHQGNTFFTIKLGKASNMYISNKMAHSKVPSTFNIEFYIDIGSVYRQAIRGFHLSNIPYSY